MSLLIALGGTHAHNNSIMYMNNQEYINIILSCCYYDRGSSENSSSPPPQTKERNPQAEQVPL